MYTSMHITLFIFFLHFFSSLYPERKFKYITQGDMVKGFLKIFCWQSGTLHVSVLKPHTHKIVIHKNITTWWALELILHFLIIFSHIFCFKYRDICQCNSGSHHCSKKNFVLLHTVPIYRYIVNQLNKTVPNHLMRRFKRKVKILVELLIVNSYNESTPTPSNIGIIEGVWKYALSPAKCVCSMCFQCVC